MKNVIVIGILLTGLNVMALSTKSCQWISGDNGSKSDTMVLSLTTKQAKVVSTSSEDIGLENQKVYGANGVVNSHQGETYISYNIPGEEYDTNLLVASDLLKSATKGYVKIRARGEGYFQATYFCTDAK